MLNIKRSELKQLSIKYLGNDSVENQNKILVMVSTAMCARVSYTVVGEEGKESNYENDIKLHDRLLQSKHFSPFEHCAKAMNLPERNTSIKMLGDGNGKIIFDERGWCLNYKGFIQYRAILNK